MITKDERNLLRFAEFFKTSRKKMFLSQQEMADLLNVSAMTISRMENGQKAPDLLFLLRYAEVLHRSLGDILNEIGFESDMESTEDRKKVG